MQADFLGPAECAGALEAKRSPGRGNAVPKIVKDQSHIRKALWMATKGCHRDSFGKTLRVFLVILEAKFDHFSWYFLASFVDRFLKGSGSICGVIFDDFWNTFWQSF